ncbi:MAG: hypothetical protein DDT30_02154 [Dehalococcoidia bacterium]|nr:hypothetical protein [Bacillota bacterium]MBT9144161.1 hypothetical protein [Bacillota bacterium]
MMPDAANWRAVFIDQLMRDGFSSCSITVGLPERDESKKVV